MKESPIRIFYCYSREDLDLRNLLESRLSLLRRQGLIHNWHDREITAGEFWEAQINQELEKADIILFLVSPDFLASDYCYEIEMKRALEKHSRQESLVIPIILRPCDWFSSPFSNIQILPSNSVPLTSWNNIDEGFLDITLGIRRVVDKIKQDKFFFKRKARKKPTSEKFNLLYTSILNNGHTPYIYVDPLTKNAFIPIEHGKNGRIVFNISPAAIESLHISEERITFITEIGGKKTPISIPIEGILAVYSREGSEFFSWT